MVCRIIVVFVYVHNLMYLRSLVGLVPVRCAVSSFYGVCVCVCVCLCYCVLQGVTVETLDRTLSRTRSGKDYGPAIRQAME